MRRPAPRTPTTPISDDERDAGSTREGAEPADPTPVGEHETEKRSIVAFLSENAGNAYTKGDVFRDVDFGDDAPPETIGDTLTEIQDELVDLARDVVASGMLVGDLDEAIDELVEEGAVAEKDIAEGCGTTTYHRLDTDDAGR